MIPLTVFGIPSNVVGMDHEVYRYLFFKYRSNIGKHSTCYYYYRPNCFLLLGPQRESITRANTHLIGGQEECQGFIIIGSTAIQLSHSWPSRNLLLCIIITYLYHCYSRPKSTGLGSAQLLLLLLVQFT